MESHILKLVQAAARRQNPGNENRALVSHSQSTPVYLPSDLRSTLSSRESTVLIVLRRCGMYLWMQWATWSSRIPWQQAFHSCWKRMVCAGSDSTTCATPVPAYCWKRAYRWSRFKSGWDTAISLPPRIFIRIWTTLPRFLRQKRCWTGLEWVQIREMTLKKVWFLSRTGRFLSCYEIVKLKNSVFA